MTHAHDAGMLFTIGHSNHPFERLVELLKSHRVQVLVDVRSQPYSKYASQFDSRELQSGIQAAGIKYVFLGEALGGRPRGQEYYDAEGHVLYGQLAKSPRFLAGIERLTNAFKQAPTAMMCSEEDPAGCHRHLLVGRVLAEQGIELRHIRGDGRVQTDADIAVKGPDAGQGLLFAEPEEATWKSLRSVLQKRPAQAALAASEQYPLSPGLNRMNWRLEAKGGSDGLAGPHCRRPADPSRQAGGKGDSISRRVPP